jgi:hypothetical protein
VRGGWTVQVYSSDGRPRQIARSGHLFKVVAINGDGNARLKDQGGYEFAILMRQNDVLLEVGQCFSAVAFEPV